DYTIFIDPHGLKGARLGLTRAGLNGFDPNVPTPQPVLDAFEEAVNALTAAGATVIDLDAAGFTFPSADGEFLVLAFDFRRDVRAYFATRVGVPVAGGTLQTAIDFDNAHADIEMPFFNQDIFEFCASLAQGVNAPQPQFGGLTYNQALAIDHDAGVNGIDRAIKRFNLDAVVSATDNPAWSTDLLRRSLHLWDVGPGSGTGISYCTSTRRYCLRRAARHQLFWNGIQRTDLD